MSTELLMRPVIPPPPPIVISSSPRRQYASPYQSPPMTQRGTFRNWVRRRISYSPGPRIQFHYMSDLRLWETDYAVPLQPTGQFKRAPRWRCKKEKKRAECLILAGNCFRLKDEKKTIAWLKRTAELYDHILVVPGIGEFYGDTIANGVRLIEKITRRQGVWEAPTAPEPDKLANVHFLNRARFDIPRSDVSVVGCTFFSSISPQQVETAREHCEAFRMIDEWDIGHHNLMHTVDSRWLKNEVRSLNEIGRRSVVVTHHAPSLVGTIREEDSNHCEALGSDCFSPGKWDGAEVWVYGGTRMSNIIYTVDGLKVISNQPRDGLKEPQDNHGGGKKDAEWSRNRHFRVARMSEWNVRGILAERKQMRRSRSRSTTPGGEDAADIVNSGSDLELGTSNEEPAGAEWGHAEANMEPNPRWTADTLVLPLPMTEEQAAAYLADLQRWYYTSRPGDE